MGQLITTYKELRVYRDAYDAALRVHRHTNSWPKEELFGLTTQIRRSSKSVCANVAESWFKRRYPRHFASKLSDACAEAAETSVHLEFARDLGYLEKDAADDLDSVYGSIVGGLVRMIAQRERWCTMPSITRDAGEPYLTARDILFDSRDPESFTH